MLRIGIRLGRVLGGFLAAAVVVWTAVIPAAGDFTNVPYTGTFTQGSFYLDPTMLEYYNPASVEVSKTSELQSGYSGANICTDFSGEPMYNTSTNPDWYYLGLAFGNGQLVMNDYPGGDRADNPTTSGGSDIVYDDDADGVPGPNEDYQLDFSQYVTNRSATITYAYGLSYRYNGTCTNDSWSYQITLGS